MNGDLFGKSIQFLKESDTMRNVLKEIPDFLEPEINFPPSYKFVGDQYSIVGSDKKRIPGYADRILFRRSVNKDLVQPNTDYQLITSATISDHKPVTCSFTITTPNGYKSNVRIITWNIGSGDNGKSADEMKDALDNLVQPYQNEYIVLTLQEANDDLYSVLKKETKIGIYTIDDNGLTSALSSNSFFGKKIYYKLVTIVLKRNPTIESVSSGGSPVIDDFSGILNGLKITKGKFGVNTKGAFNTVLLFGETGLTVNIINLHFPFDNNITYNDFKIQLEALNKALEDSDEWCIMAGDYNSRSNIILDAQGNAILAITGSSIFNQHELNAIFGKGLQVHPINSELKTKPTKFVPPTGSLEAYEDFCNKLYKFYSIQQQQQQLNLPPLPPDLLALSRTPVIGGSKLRKTRKYKKIIRKKNKKHTNKYKKHKYILRKRTNKKRKY